MLSVDKQLLENIELIRSCLQPGSYDAEEALLSTLQIAKLEGFREAKDVIDEVTSKLDDAYPLDGFQEISQSSRAELLIQNALANTELKYTTLKQDNMNALCFGDMGIVEEELTIEDLPIFIAYYKSHDGTMYMDIFTSEDDALNTLVALIRDCVQDLKDRNMKYRLPTGLKTEKNKVPSHQACIKAVNSFGVTWGLDSKGKAAYGTCDLIKTTLNKVGMMNDNYIKSR